MGLYFDVHPDDLYDGPNWDFFFTRVGSMIVLTEVNLRQMSKVSTAFFLLLKPSSSAAPMYMMAE